MLNITTTKPVNIVLDAVDEVPSNLRHVLLSAIARIVRDSLSIVKVFVTSRDDNNIRLLLPNALTFRVEKEYTRSVSSERLLPFPKSSPQCVHVYTDLRWPFAPYLNHLREYR